MAIAALPPEWYWDAAIARRERDAIFGSNWALFGPAAGLEAGGSWRAAEINGIPIFAIRGEDGVLRGFRNLCRHRGAMLLCGDAGSAKLVSCPYHGWTYGLTGELRATPGFDVEGAFDRGQYGLLPLRVETWQGLVFVSSDLSGCDLAAWLGDLPRLCAGYPLAPQMDFHGSYVVEGGANWKAYCDNTVEGYHLPMVHPRLARAVASNEVRIEAFDEGRLVVFTVRYQAEDRSLRGSTGLWFYRFPGFQGVVGPTGFKAERIEPIGADRLRSSSWHWYGGIGAAEREAAFAWSRQIVQEDIAICETVQRNLSADGFPGAWLSPLRERHTARFQQLVRDALSDDASPC
jgi:choline monooxygenase